MAHDLDAIIRVSLSLLKASVGPCAFIFTSLSKVVVSASHFDRLSVAERSHAMTLSLQERQMYVCQRLIRRHILAAFTGCLPDEVCYDCQGARPRLVGWHDCFFSVSHSQDAFAIALSRTRDCGIDFEVWRPVRYKRRIAQRFFSEYERQFLVLHDYADAIFFQVWTQKEALVKLYAQSMYHYACQYDVREDRVYRGHSECGVDMFAHSADGFSVALASEQPSSPFRVTFINCVDLCCQYL